MLKLEVINVSLLCERVPTGAHIPLQMTLHADPCQLKKTKPKKEHFQTADRSK